MISSLLSECLRLTEDYPLIQLVTIATISGYVYYQILLVRKAILHAKHGSSFTKNLLEDMPILQENYKPTFWCFEARVQTVLSSLLRRTLPDIKYQREVRGFVFKGSNYVYEDKCFLFPDIEVV